VNLSLIWQGDLKFCAGPGGPPIELDSAAAGVLSPMQTLGYAVMACMAMDVVHMLQKGRHDLQELSVVLDAERAPETPSSARSSSRERSTAQRGIRFDKTFS